MATAASLPDWWRPYVARFVSRVRMLAMLDPTVNLTVTSWGRSVSHNAAVGGDSRSQHLIWTAVDLVPSDGDLEGLAAAARYLGFGYVVNEGDHVHVQEFPAGVVPDQVYVAVLRA